MCDEHSESINFVDKREKSSDPKNVLDTKQASLK